MARGQRRRLSADELLSIDLLAFCSRHQYTAHPVPVIDELRRRAGNRTDILAVVAGLWAGYYGDEYTRALAGALGQIEGASQWVALGRQRRGRPPHATP